MKYKIYLYIIFKVISVSIQLHLEIIENLKLKITTKEKKKLKQALELSKKLYEANPVEDSDINKYAKTIQLEIIDYHYMRKKKKENVKIYNCEKMRELLPEKFLDSFNSIYLSILYIKDKLFLTVQRENIETEFNKLLSLIEEHSKYFEDNYIEKFYEEAKVE